MLRTEYSWLSNEELLAVAELAGDTEPLVVELRQRLMIALDVCDELADELGVEVVDGDTGGACQGSC